ncbi:MAG: GNAT family protein [Aggregatilineales bacterium]
MPLEGKLVILREERDEDVPIFQALRNNLETQAWPKTLPPDYTLGMYMRRHERDFSLDRRDGRFAIEWKENGACVGHIGYSDLVPRWSASIGITIHQDYWGTGAAHDSVETLLKFLFEELGLRVVRLWTNSGNPAAVKVAQKSGFRISARGREAVFRKGALYDSLVMDLLREEYYERHPELTDGLPPL